MSDMRHRPTDTFLIYCSNTDYLKLQMVSVCLYLDEKNLSYIFTMKPYHRMHNIFLNIGTQFIMLNKIDQIVNGNEFKCWTMKSQITIKENKIGQLHKENVLYKTVSKA